MGAAHEQVLGLAFVIVLVAMAAASVLIGRIACGRYAAPRTADGAGAVWKIAAVATARELLLGRSWAS